jgi:hypothetical protein
MKVLMKPINASAPDFNKVYYESQTYILGKNLVGSLVWKKVFFIKKRMAVFG